MKRIPLFFIILSSLLQNSELFSQIGGRSTYSFLDLPYSARVASLGGSMVPVKDDDLNLALLNPALLNRSMDDHLTFTKTFYMADVNYYYLGYVKTWKKIGTFSYGVQAVDYGNFIQADPTGQITGSFTAADYSYNIGYGKQLDSMFSIGATVKTVYSHLEQYSSVGSLIDLGANYNNTKRLFDASLVIKGIGYQWKTYTDGNHEPLPFQIQAAVSKKLSKAPFRVSLVAQHLEKWDLTYSDSVVLAASKDPITGVVPQQSKAAAFADKLGRHIVANVEMLLGKNLSLRLGYNYERRKELELEGHGGIAGLTFGVGVKIAMFNISYAYAQYNVAGASNHLTLTMNFGDFLKKKSAT